MEWRRREFVFTTAYCRLFYFPPLANWRQKTKKWTHNYSGGIIIIVGHIIINGSRSTKSRNHRFPWETEPSADQFHLVDCFNIVVIVSPGRKTLFKDYYCGWLGGRSLTIWWRDGPNKSSHHHHRHYYYHRGRNKNRTPPSLSPIWFDDGPQNINYTKWLYTIWHSS